MYGYSGATMSGHHIIKSKEDMFKNFKKVEKAIIEN